ncbi:TAFII55 protein conserved region-domain-containing protein [Trichophaea hybrida]|nr:TAFII55 protein conserved region-domain-containing protein [Trichophaea hybrida]
MVKLKISAAALQSFNQASPPPPLAAAPPSGTPAKPPPKPKASKLKVPKTTATPKAVPKAPAADGDTPAPKPKKKPTKKATAAAAAVAAANGAAPTPPPAILPKIKIRTSSLATAAASAANTPTDIKPVRPKLKLTSSSVTAAAHAAAATPITAHPVRTPTIKLKHTSKPSIPRKRRHEPGNGYDSEASDREDDPAIEENFILRMQPGPDCDYLREVIERKELNVTSDVWMKFKEPRKAVVNVRGHLYAAVLVDLPCVIEGNKTLDKKNIFKVADICQMLLVTQRITHEEEIWNIRFNFSDLQYPHGLTPPMQYARKRRFRKRISNRTIEAVETEVDRLLRDDEAAESTKFNLVDAEELNRSGTPASDAEAGYDLLGEEEYDDEQDADGEVDVEYEYAPQEDVEMDEDTLANDLESALFNGSLDEDVTTSAEVQPEAEAESDTSDEDEEEEAQQQEPELDDAAKEVLQQKEKLKEEIQDIEEMIATKAKEYEKTGNAILKARVGKVIAGLRSQLELKQDMLAQMGG